MKIVQVPVGALQANCYLVSDDAGTACAIDPGGEPERLFDIAGQKGLSLTHVLVTHGHFDHVGGVAGLASLTGAGVWCAPPVAVALRSPDGCMAPRVASIASASGLAVSVVAEGDAIRVGDLVVTVIETPGHSPGDLTFEIGGHLFCGDLLFHRSVGRTDLPGGDWATLLASVGKLASRYPAATPVHPGHMESTTLGEELAENPFLRGIASS